MRSNRWLWMAAVLGLAGAARVEAQCTGPNHVLWPAANPVWEFCWQRPADSGLADGEGIELTDVKYNGVLVLKRAHMPVINVKYVSGGCGCYRDWTDSERAFECDPVLGTGYCSGKILPARTTCDVPGSDLGSFTGVSVEDLGTELKLTSQTSAGWYRYIPVWIFYPDGRLQARMDAGAVNNSCVAYTHRHHVYFRLDVDIGASGTDDYVDYAPNADQPFTRVPSERSFTDTSPSRSVWRVGSAGQEAILEIARQPGDEAAGDPPDPVTGDFPVADGWALAYNASEIEDRGTSCAIDLTPYYVAAPQNVNGNDVVLWVRASNLHEGEAGGISHECFMFGPMLRVLSPNATPTPTETQTPTETPTETLTPTVTETETPTATPTVTETETPTPTATATVTETATPTATETPTSTATPTETPTETPTLTSTPSSTSTPTPTATFIDLGATPSGGERSGALILVLSLGLALWFGPRLRSRKV